MSHQENLNKYERAYTESFKHNDENYYFLSRYADVIRKSIRLHEYHSVLSLGIGHSIVTDCIMDELKQGLQLYTILEGAKNIADAFSAKVNDSRVEIVHTYFEDYETERQYDVIEMGFVLEHVDDPAEILLKYKKLLKKGGTCFVGVPNAASLHRRIGFEAGLLEDLYCLSPADMELGHKRYFDLNAISGLIVEAGFKIKATTGLLLKPITASQMKQLGWGEGIYSALLTIGDSYPELSNCILIECEL